MDTNRYSRIVEWSPGDECFIARVPEFPGLSAFGDSPDEALAEAAIALKLFIESYVADGIDLPSPQIVSDYSGKLNLRLPKTLHRQLAERADAEGVSLNTHIITMLSEGQATNSLASEVRAAINDAVDGVHKSWLAVHFKDDSPQAKPKKSTYEFPVLTHRSAKLWSDTCQQ
ncbi:MAG: toxin-antitoxin system HicB family antitoxin [Humidesulfovibrio sp.]|nr:toxin-antitoxin system HicB family antitoxin [Humidesulfovibrio sp.]